MAKRSSVAYAAFLWVAVALVAAAPRASAPASVSGGIYVTTLPSGADVFLDGTYVGHSPVLLSGLDRGRYSLTLTKPGWVVREIEVGVPRGTVTLFSTRLVPGPRAYAGNATGNLLVRGALPGASLLVDDTPLQTAPGQAIVLPAGSHRVSVVTSRGRTNRSIDVMPDMTTEVVVESPRESQSDAHSAIVAPAEDYLPTDNFALEGQKVTVHYGGHTIVCHLGVNTVRFDGRTRAYSSAAEVIGNKLYLPLTLLETLTGDSAK